MFRLFVVVGFGWDLCCAFDCLVLVFRILSCCRWLLGLVVACCLLLVVLCWFGSYDVCVLLFRFVLVC